jgi:ribosomal protein L29
MKKSDIQKLTPKEREAKIAELEKAILELKGEGKPEKVKPLRKAIAALKTQKA